MQTAAKLVVLLFIVPAAVLIAVFFITEPMIPVVITRQFVSLSVAMCLAGLLVARARRPLLGGILVLAGCAVGAAALALFWSSLFATVACLHGFLITTLFTAQSLGRRGVISEPRAAMLRCLLSASVVFTGPFAGTAYAVTSSFTPDAVAETTFLLLMLYMVVLQYYLKEARLGLFNVALLSLVFATIMAPILFEDALNPNIALVGSSFIFVLGIGLVLSSQSLRIIRNLVAKRPADRKKRDTLVRSLLEPMVNEPKDIEPEPSEAPEAGEWIVSPYHAHVTSALGVFLTALGIPANFLFRARLTGWGTVPVFDPLFVPLAVLVTLLVLVPSPVFLRMGRIITRHREGFIVHLLGIGVVLAAAFSTFEWTQFSLWSMETSVASSLFLVLAGLTGLFKEVRRLWRRGWMSIANSFRTLRRWVTSHPVQTGVVADSVLTWLIVSFLYPTFSQQTMSYVGFLSLSAVVFALIALLGIAGLKGLRKRMLFAALAWSTLLYAAAVFSFWYMVDAMSVSLPDAASVAVLGMLGMAVLLRLGFRRRVSVGPYAIGVIGVIYQFARLGLLEGSVLNLIFPTVWVVILAKPYLQEEYRAALFRLRGAAARAWAAVVHSIRAFRGWLVAHPIHTGVVIDLFLTLVLVYLLYPSFSTQTGSYFGFLTLSASFFSLFAVAGVGLLKHLVKRMQIAALAWSAFLCAAAASTFWYVTNTMGVGIVDASPIAGVWLIGTVGLLRLGYQRRVPAIPYAIGVLCLAYYLWRMDIILAGTASALPLTAAYGLTLPFLHNEYSALFSRLGNALWRRLAALARAVRAAAAAAYYALSRLGAAVYRGILFLTVLIVKFVLLVYGMLLTSGIFYLGYSVLRPEHGFDPVMAVALSAALFFVLYTPAVMYKSKSRPRLVAGFAVALAASVSVFLFLNLARTYPDTPEMSLVGSVAVGLGMAAFFRGAFPERVRAMFAPALCLLIISYGSAFVFRQVLAVQPVMLAAAVAGIPFAAGLLAMGVKVKYRKIASAGYGIVIAPSSLVVCYTIFADIVLLPVAVLLALAPVAYPYYARAARALAILTLKALKALFTLVLTYLVFMFVIVSATATIALFQAMQTFFDAYLYPDLARTTFFALLFIAIWIPAVLYKRTSFARLASVLVVLLSLLSAIFTMTWLQPLGTFETLLIGAAVCSLMLTAFSGVITEMPSWRIPLAVMLFSLLLLGLNLVVLEFTLELLIAAFCTVMIVIVAGSRKVALRLTYSLATATGLAMLFQVVLLPIVDPILAAAMYVGLEALLLCIVKAIYRWPLWVIFCACASYVVYTVLLPLTQAAIFLAFLVGLELLRMTSDEKSRLHVLGDAVAVARALLVGLIAGFLIGGHTTLVLTLAVSTLFGLLVLGFHLVGRPKTRYTILMEDAIVAVVALIIAESIAVLLGQYTLISFFGAAIPTAEVLVTRVQRNTYVFGHYCALSILVALMAASFWLLLGYGFTESIPLMLSSGLTAASMLYFGRPSLLLTEPRNTVIPITVLIIALEVVWMWHALVVFHLSGALTLVGAGLLLSSTLLYPASSTPNWLRFEYIWDITSAVNAISLGAVASFWDLWAGLVPPYPLVTLGWCLSLYSLFSSPVLLIGQRTLGIERTAHMNWAPSLVAWPLLVWSYGSASLVQPGLLFGLTGLALCAAAGVFFLIHPQRTSTMVRWLHAGLASIAALLTWESGVIPRDLVLYRLAATLTVTYLVLFPVTVPLTIAAGKRLVQFFVTHKRAFALLLPGLAGLAVFLLVIQQEAGLILGMQSRQLVGSFGIGMLVSGLGWILARPIVDSAKRPGAASTFLGIFAAMLSIVMPPTLVAVPDIVYRLFICLTASLFLLSVVAIYLHLATTKHLAHAAGGIAVGVATFSGLTYYYAANVLNAILAAVIVVFVIELPFLKEQILALIHLLGNLGALIAAALRRLGAVLKAIFLRFGYVMWSIFSILVVIGVGYLSFPFFSELVGMQLGRPLYVIPSYSMPLMLLGLLLITVTAARRKVKTRFGRTGVLTTLAGGGLTGVSWLLDKDLLFLAASLTIAIASLVATAANRAKRADIVRIAVGWTPTPIACGITLFSVLNPDPSDFSLQVVAAGLSVLVISVLLAGSVKINLIPKDMTRYFMVVIALASGVITYASADLASMDFLARVYLSVFVVSWLVLPVARREWIQLFYAPLFFSLTGFAFTFVFGQLSQSLLLAMAAFLLFVTLLVRDREKARPKLVFLRLALLVLLAGCIAAFTVISLLSALTA